MSQPNPGSLPHPVSSRAAVVADLRRDRETGSLVSFVTLGRVLLAPRLQAVLLYRLANALHRRRLGALATVVKYVNGVLTGCDIASSAQIGPGLRLNHPVGIVIGPRVVIGGACTVMQGVTLGEHPKTKLSPHVGGGVFIGPNVVVVGGLEIGAGASLGANSVVTRSVPEGEVWAGSPARPLTASD